MLLDLFLVVRDLYTITSDWFFVSWQQPRTAINRLDARAIALPTIWWEINYIVALSLLRAVISASNNLIHKYGAL